MDGRSAVHPPAEGRRPGSATRPGGRLSSHPHIFAHPDLDLRIGYRLLEGGSDGGGLIYTFSMFLYLGAGVQWGF